MSQPIVWIHGDCLSPNNPGLQKYPNAPAIWVWDEALIEEWQLTLKRIAFIYECLLELPVVIRRGDVAQEILAFAQEHDADLVVTAASPSPRFNDICDQIEPSLKLEVLEIEPFFVYDGYIDLKRFSRYWKVAEKYVWE
ncbi:MAG: universal stress protein [Nostoc sp. LLA-1]|nr:universal stress protein [Cyanocohniella sp. LLY]